MADYTVILEGNGAMLTSFLFRGDEYRLKFTQSDVTPISIEKVVEIGPGVAQWSPVAQAVRQRSGGLCMDSRMIGHRADPRLLEAANEALREALSTLEAMQKAG